MYNRHAVGLSSVSGCQDNNKKNLASLSHKNLSEEFLLHGSLGKPPPQKLKHFLKHCKWYLLYVIFSTQAADQEETHSLGCNCLFPTAHNSVIQEYVIEKNKKKKTKERRPGEEK